MAHGSNVSCLSLGPSSGRVMVTGGEDRKVNMWAVGKPNVILVRLILSLDMKWCIYCLNLMEIITNKATEAQ